MSEDISTAASHANLPFGTLVIQALDRLGVEHFILSPGSRSTPLALAVGSLGAGKSTVFIDERSAAFHALGRIKATRRPVALICTSGTAGAHYYPAVIEAREAGLPLIVLTADRPPEQRYCHHGQTIDQQKLFGSYPLFHAELPVPETGSSILRAVREICRRAVEASLGIPNGPVHLNCPFREPFFPKEEEAGDPDPSLLEGLKPVVAARSTSDLPLELPERTLILAGPRPWKDPQSELDAILELSTKRGFPILTDGSNPLRYSAGDAAQVIVHHDRIVRDDALWKSLAPEAVVLWGEPPTSKLLRQRLSELDLPGFQVGSGKPGMNPFHGKIEWAGTSLEAFVGRVDGPAGSFGAIWAEEDGRMESRLAAVLDEPHPLFEGDIHRVLSQALAAGTPVCFASSLAIRDAEWFMPRSKSGLVPFSQRGANGIDGTLSLARGIAAGSGHPVCLVTGDLAFLHDSNGLLGSASDENGLLVILINNSGGGIFEHLPVAGKSADFERFFGTPQEVDFKQLSEAHGARHQRVESIDELQWAIEVWNPAGVTVIEIPVDRKISRDLHRRFIGSGFGK
ncbi:2-succinyl-5-enolpyruvyl-6-hydroxy-3-cyclohexene-1-carboxylic-acid synthase [Puniceicoccales bacterium CK1056]|uniref:2-succinyl-5-enolpyruvyl-6-hydroxy-3-cyclohexene-1-carboxylate synthase n=1 Tax=Oceanipulchritudo coccoides TaxID=2706888 RepID=A0A6B2M3C2_9BACT|nr:2-succinyl-5-enolpyruvyl-6-hydroxy-3-cyclohexene-1-carboxylic-acid synthase [Oceanipulchritudo coccoides]NDV63458.1 2-succinyl-5-enolpyruvyl-6-hydroxy-3-cyclohexene-1-carboxylic-acid synthase [Oceanipulchritudo coccoides]